MSLALPRLLGHHKAVSGRWVVVIFPDDADLTDVEGFRARWDPLAGSVAAHVTLVFPFEPTTMGAGRTARAIAEVAASHPPFLIQLADPAVSDSEYLFLLARQGAPQIRDLHADLYTALPDAHTDGGFVAHMTIGRSGDPAALAQAADTARTLGLHVSGTARAVSVYLIDQQGRRQVSQTVPLGQRRV